MNESSHPHPSSPCRSGWPCESSYTLNKEGKDVLLFVLIFFSTCKFLIDFEGLYSLQFHQIPVPLEIQVDLADPNVENKNNYS